MLEANGITKKEALSIINESSQKTSQPIASLRIENKVEKIQQILERFENNITFTFSKKILPHGKIWIR